MNSCRCAISGDNLFESSEDEILKSLSEQATTAARQISLCRNGQERPMKHLILTFDSAVLPQSIKASYLHYYNNKVYSRNMHVDIFKTHNLL